MASVTSRPQDWPLMERPYIAFWLAIIAGAMSGFTFYTVHLFSTVQSGNVIQAGAQIATGDGVKWEHAMLAILAFGLGSALTGIIQNLLADIHVDYSYIILAIEAVVLVALGLSFFSDRWSLLTYAYIVSFLAGMQGNAFHMIKGNLYGNVAVTLVVQLAFNHFVQAFFHDRRSHLIKSGLFFLVLLGFALGGFIGAWSTKEYEERALWLIAALTAALAIWGFVKKDEGRPVDIPFS